MRILALIPARSGSKRLPGKNIRILGEKPLVVWSIDVAKGIPEICDILVSTDDTKIAEIGEAAEALVPWLRPFNLATDVASSVDVALHALDWYEAEMGTVDGLMLLQPTSPFRTQESVRRGIEIYKKNGLQPVLGVSLTAAHPMWALKIVDDHLMPILADHGLGSRSQDLQEVFTVNGSFYLTSPASLRSQRSFWGDGASPLIIESPEEALDIDTNLDFMLAECIENRFHDV
jgi:N-acylneuraminate cytidylyltransferase